MQIFKIELHKERHGYECVIVGNPNPIDNQVVTNTSYSTEMGRFSFNDICSITW